MENDSTLDADVGGRLRAVRKRHGLLQVQLGELTGTSQNAISDWERGTSTLPLTVALALQATLGVRHQWLLTGEGAPYIQMPDVDTLFPLVVTDKKPRIKRIL